MSLIEKSVILTEVLFFYHSIYTKYGAKVEKKIIQTKFLDIFCKKSE